VLGVVLCCATAAGCMIIGFYMMITWPHRICRRV